MGPLFRRLLLWFCLANIVTLFVSVAVTRHLVRELYHHEPDWPALAQQTAALYAPGAEHPAAALRPLRKALYHRRIAVGLVDATGQVLLWPPHWVLGYREALSKGAEVMLHPHRDVTLVGLSVTGPDGKPWRFIGVRFPPRRGPFHWWPFAIEILVSLFVIAGVGWWVARSIGRPVGAVQDAARRVARGELDTRVGTPVTDADDELGQLGRDFDHMAGRIQALLERQRGVLQDVSHELRSPLTRLGLTLELARAEAGAAAQPALDRAEREIQRLDQAIGEVLELSRMEVQAPGRQHERLDLRVLVAERVDEVRAGLAGEAVARPQLRVVPAADAVEVSANRVLLARAVDNLLSNAAKFSPPGAEVEVCVGSDGAVAWVQVSDHGPGVPEAEIKSLFRPFFRGSNGARATGHGLGLAIVARIANAHGGRAVARNWPQGGLCMRFELPAAPTV